MHCRHLAVNTSKKSHQHQDQFQVADLLDFLKYFQS